MNESVELRSRGKEFNEIADQYDHHRPAYPDALIDRACEVAGIAAGASVLEIGCGTGQLTRSLLARGLRVVAVEPGERLIARAKDRLAGRGDVQFINATLEEAPLVDGRYHAVFSASAIHWVDPDVSWRKAAALLVNGGTLALLSYFGLEDAHSHDDQAALREALAKVAAEVACEWPEYREHDAMLAGAARRVGNVSELWGWLGDYDLARPDAADLFEEVRYATMPVRVEHSADALNGVLRTMSFWPRLSADQQEELSAENRALGRRLGRPIRSSTVACLVTARRTPRPAASQR